MPKDACMQTAALSRGNWASVTLDHAPSGVEMHGRLLWSVVYVIVTIMPLLLVTVLFCFAHLKWSSWCTSDISAFGRWLPEAEKLQAR
ncbi:hypothetical protein P389DRAFT_36059 [Cystobasidium minutum MCA 4210]|uniref:uncharacterized protein n=1 Tax=Cystobasidium minutum MCA 4210 TaxID=1397322 RepID=UPI0034CD1F6E|eukprot:jgi/Rhomi1/36059/CE36058_59